MADATDTWSKYTTPSAPPSAPSAAPSSERRASAKPSTWDKYTAEKATGSVMAGKDVARPSTGEYLKRAITPENVGKAAEIVVPTLVLPEVGAGLAARAVGEEAGPLVTAGARLLGLGGGAALAPVATSAMQGQVPTLRESVRQAAWAVGTGALPEYAAARFLKNRVPMYQAMQPLYEASGQIPSKERVLADKKLVDVIRSYDDPATGKPYTQSAALKVASAMRTDADTMRESGNAYRDAMAGIAANERQRFNGMYAPLLGQFGGTPVTADTAGQLTGTINQGLKIAAQPGRELSSKVERWADDRLAVMKGAAPQLSVNNRSELDLVESLEQVKAVRLEDLVEKMVKEGRLEELATAKGERMVAAAGGPTAATAAGKPLDINTLRGWSTEIDRMRHGRGLNANDRAFLNEVDNAIEKQIKSNLTAAGMAPEDLRQLDKVDNMYRSYKGTMQAFENVYDRNFGDTVAREIFNTGRQGNWSNLAYLMTMAKEADKANPAILPTLREAFMTNFMSDVRASGGTDPEGAINMLRAAGQLRRDFANNAPSVLKTLFPKGSPLQDEATFVKVIGKVSDPLTAAAARKGAAKLAGHVPGFMLRLASGFAGAAAGAKITGERQKGSGSPYGSIFQMGSLPGAGIGALLGIMAPSMLGEALTSGDAALSRAGVAWLNNPESMDKAKTVFELAGRSLSVTRPAVQTLFAPVSGGPAAPSTAPAP